MRSMEMMTAAMLLACVPYSRQENSKEIQDYPDEPERSALSDGQIVRLVRTAYPMNYPQTQELVRRRRNDDEQDQSESSDHNNDNRRRSRKSKKRRKPHKRQKSHKNRNPSKKYSFNINFAPNLDLSNSYPGGPAAPAAPTAPEAPEAPEALEAPEAPAESAEQTDLTTESVESSDVNNDNRRRFRFRPSRIPKRPAARPKSPKRHKVEFDFNPPDIDPSDLFPPEDDSSTESETR